MMGASASFVLSCPGVLSVSLADVVFPAPDIVCGGHRICHLMQERPPLRADLSRHILNALLPFVNQDSNHEYLSESSHFQRPDMGNSNVDNLPERQIWALKSMLAGI
jgi:hypothetical protein